LLALQRFPSILDGRLSVGLVATNPIEQISGGAGSSMTLA
jgi:hypothetical protein